MDLVVVFPLFIFMLALLCFFDATVFTVNKDLYIKILKITDILVDTDTIPILSVSTQLYERYIGPGVLMSIAVSHCGL